MIYSRSMGIYTSGNNGFMFLFLSVITLMKYFCLVCVSYRERAEKQRMYSVSQGLNSG